MHEKGGSVPARHRPPGGWTRPLAVRHAQRILRDRTGRNGRGAGSTLVLDWARREIIYCASVLRIHKDDRQSLVVGRLLQERGEVPDGSGIKLVRACNT